MRNNSADIKGSGGGWVKGAPGSRSGIPLEPLVQTMVRKLQLMEVYGGAEIHLQPEENPSPEQVDTQRKL